MEREMMNFEFEEFEEFDNLIGSVTQASPAVKKDSSYSRLQYLIDNTTAIIYASVPTGDFKMNYVSNNAKLVLGFTPEQMMDDPNFMQMSQSSSHLAKDVILRNDYIF